MCVRTGGPLLKAELVVLEGEDACLAAAGDGVTGPVNGSGVSGWSAGTHGEARGANPGSRNHRSHLATLDFNLQQVSGRQKKLFLAVSLLSSSFLSLDFSNKPRTGNEGHPIIVTKGCLPRRIRECVNDPYLPLRPTYARRSLQHHGPPAVHS